MPFCSLCNKEYDDKIKNCALSHCVACGSTRIWSEKNTKINPVSLIMIFGFFAIIFLAIFVEVPSVFYVFIGVFIVLIGTAVSDSFKSHTVNLCLNCFAKGFEPLTKIKLQDAKKDVKETFSQIDPQEIQKLLKIDVKGKGKFNFRNVFLIFSLAVAIIGIIFSQLIQEWVNSIFN